MCRTFDLEAKLPGCLGQFVQFVSPMVQENLVVYIVAGRPCGNFNMRDSSASQNAVDLLERRPIVVDVL